MTVPSDTVRPWIYWDVFDKSDKTGMKRFETTSDRMKVLNVTRDLLPQDIPH